MEESFEYEVARLEPHVSKNFPYIGFYNGRGESGIGYFKSFEEAKTQLAIHKTKHPSEKWPYVIISYSDDKGKIVYVEYDDYSLSKK